jgi:hypothetical protein
MTPPERGGAARGPESDGGPLAPESEAAQWLTPGPALGAEARLGIYRRGYRARLVECLADDYPVLREALGSERFEQLCHEYIERHPSAGPNLNAFGRHMPALCAARDDGGVPPAFAANLASLEWAVVEVIHAAGAPPLSLEALGNVAPERWADARLVPTPALVVVRSEYPVNAYYQAARDGRRPAVPSAERSATAVYRSGPTVWRMDLSVPMLGLLERLTSNETLAASLDGATAAFDDVPEDVAAQRVTAWFREWVASGLFAGVVWPE